MFVVNLVKTLINFLKNYFKDSTSGASREWRRPRLYVTRYGVSPVTQAPVTNDVTSIVFPGNWREETQTPDTTSKTETESTTVKQLGEAAPEKSPEGPSENKVPEPETDSSTVASHTPSVSSVSIGSQGTVTEPTAASGNGTVTSTEGRENFAGGCLAGYMRTPDGRCKVVA
ncbi:Growth-blocking peptide, long form [Eumeta japonica]|uniref:Growth-blocking peptide, long form n=1 Tax=Eumeta variegata TaxID=151549 RepID=A0A4C2AD35_EUMVA|nr:Growth-blocking peptide, long form [Eumeta japonica]